MRKISLIALVSMMPLFIGGCLIGEDAQQGDKGSPSPSPIARRIPQKPLVSASPEVGKLAIKQPNKEKPIPGLIQSLPAGERLKQSLKGRSDPFAVIPTVPLVIPPSPTSVTGNRDVPPLPSLSQPRSNPVPFRAPSGTPVVTREPGTTRPPVATRPPVKSPTKPSPKTNTPLSKPPAIGLLPPPIPNPKITPLLPKLPEPTLAKGIEVTGVVEVAGVPNAIVKAPNEPTTRSVREGERLSNGQVLVKRIEMNQGPNPIVILEQFGIEVARQVGDKAVSASSATPGAAPTEPVPPPQPDAEQVPPPA